MNDIASPAVTRPSGAPVSLPGAVAAGDVGRAPAAPRAPSWLARRWRLLTALGLLGLAAVALLRQQLVLSTEHAVISAYAIPMRTPIGGELTAIAAQAGAALQGGMPLARVENALADRRPLLDATAEHDRAHDEAAAIGRQIAALDAIAAALTARAEELRAESQRMLAASLAEGLSLHAAAETRARRLSQDAARAIELARSGVAATALRERAEAEHDAALREAAALAARSASLRAQESAAARGLYLTGGYGGVSYLEQRLDEVALRRGELLRQQATQEAAAARAAARVAAEAERLATEREAVLHAPADWHAWRVLARPGQRVLAEDVLAELVDCRDIFVLAAIPQDDAPAIAPGQTVRLRLAGEAEERPGTVLGWMPDGMAREGGRLAVLPTRPLGNSQLLRVAIAPPEPGAPCPVGRTGRLLLDRHATPMSRLDAATPR